MQRKLPSKRYSSYVPPSELSALEDQVSTLTESSQSDQSQGECSVRAGSVGGCEKALRRRSLNTLHFDALQNAVSTLARIDDFHLEELGYGFFSDVFKVTHKQSGKVMVLKRNKTTNTKLNILREVQLMNRLSHPNILKFMGVCVHEGQLHALTEFINGGDLDQLVQQKATALSWIVRIQLALDIARGLYYLHSKGIFHRDVTAKNMLVRVENKANGKKKYTAVVADLGLAEKIPSGPKEEARLKIVGTPYCMAPEVLRNKPYNELSDIFSFGIVLCQLTLRVPSDPDKLPRSKNFGLARDLYFAMVTSGVGAPESTNGPILPPNSLIQLTYDCCEIDPPKRPSLQSIMSRLDQALAWEKKSRTEKKKQAILTDANLQNPKTLEKISNQIPPVSSPSSQADKENGAPAIVLEKGASVEKDGANPNKRRSSQPSSFPRLSRSFSDLSTELISHAASIIASSNEKIIDQDRETIMSSLGDLFINPFNDLEEPGNYMNKIFDLPSSEVLEMTFDLPQPKLTLASPSHVRRVHNLRANRRRSLRPNSLVLDLEKGMGDESIANAFNRQACRRFSGPSVTSPRRLSAPDRQSKRSGSGGSSFWQDCLKIPVSCPHSPVSSPLSPQHSFESYVPDKQQARQALIRSMVLSPQGCRLLSWWHNRGKSIDWHSINTLFTTLSLNSGKMRSSISLPDLSIDSAIFTNDIHKQDQCTRQKSISQAHSTLPTSRKIHYDSSSLPRRKARSVHNNTTSLTKRRSKTVDNVFQDPSFLEILPEEVGTTETASVTSTARQDDPPSSIEINNNGLREKSLYERRDTSTTIPKYEAHVDIIHLHSVKTPVLSNPCESQDCNSDNVSSASSSSASSAGLEITIKTGMVSSTRRRTSSALGDTAIFSQLNEEEKKSVGSHRRSHRDSGFNEDNVVYSERFYEGCRNSS